MVDKKTYDQIVYERDKIKREMAEMAERGAVEIAGLQFTLRALEPKAEAYELMRKLINVAFDDHNTMGYQEDIASMMRKRAEELRQELIRDAKPNPDDVQIPEV